MLDRNCLWQVCVVATGLAAAACGPRYVLEPAKSADEVSGVEDAARAQQNGVTLIATADAWHDVGHPEVLTEVTPLRLTIENDSSRTVQIKYQNLALAGEQSAKRYAALPPLEVEGEISKRKGIANPRWRGTGYQVAPYYGSAYGNYAPVWGGGFIYDYGYYDRYYPRYAALELPTEEMLRHALPEGTLQPGGRVDGFVYFEKIDEQEGEVILRAKVVDAENDEAIATLAVPFAVDD